MDAAKTVAPGVCNRVVPAGRTRGPSWGLGTPMLAMDGSGPAIAERCTITRQRAGRPAWRTFLLDSVQLVLQVLGEPGRALPHRLIHMLVHIVEIQVLLRG